MIKKLTDLTAIMIFAALSATNYAIFIFPNRFAPAGIDGICTMIQDTLNINIGYLSLLVNIPLIILAFMFLSKDYAVKSTVYIASFSIVSLILGSIDLSKFCYCTDSGTSIVFAPIVAGTIRGLLYYVTIKLNGSSGGVDIISALVKHKKPHLELMNIIFAFNMVVALCSYFVYDLKQEPVICSIIYSFITTSVTNKIRESKDKNIKYEIITPTAGDLCLEISKKFHQAATIIDAHGAYSGIDTKMVVCVVSKRNAPFIEEIIKKHKDCVVFKSSVGSTISGITYQ
ncbi:MAG: YitT family protein [Clostridia bacterium]|nr:YitT family protein [Clostridia bacterium]